MTADQTDIDQSDIHPDDLPEEQVLPLDAWHRAQGARMVEFAGYQMPIQYTGEGGGIVAEHEWTRTHASLFDVSHMGQLSLEGEDAAEALEALVPGDISALKPGRMRYSLLLDENGGILDDLIITNTGQHLGLVVNGAVKWDDIAHLREHLPDEVTLTHYADQALLALQGPQAGAVLEALIPGTGALTFMTAGAGRAIPGKTGSKFPLPPIMSKPLPTRWWPMPAFTLPGWARATACAWKRDCHCMAMIWAPKLTRYQLA